jgi:hypothetical protein
MDKLIEVKIDRKTLPLDGQRIKWQTPKDQMLNRWKEGVFSQGDDLFLVGFNETSYDWDLADNVIHWTKI